MPIQREGETFVLSNDFLRRVIDVTAGPKTVHYQIRPNGLGDREPWLPVFAFDPHTPFEAAVCVEDRWLQAGPLAPPADGAWQRRGAFRVVNACVETTDLGEALTLACRTCAEGAPDLELALRYEIASDLPLLVRSVTVTNRSDCAVTIDNVTVDTIKRNRCDAEVMVATDYYWPTAVEDDYYAGWVRREFPEPLGRRLSPGESLRSFRCLLIVAPNDPVARVVARHRVIKRLAPWLTRPLIAQQVDGLGTFDELIACADRAAAVGIECVHLFVSQLFTNVGDYVPRPDLFPAGEDDVRRLVEQFHARGVKVLPYCSLTIGNYGTEVHTQHEDWQYLGPGGKRYVPVAHGNMCYQSGWGPYITQKLHHLFYDLGFDGLHIDGPYHGLPCEAEHHRHGVGGNVRFCNWEWERDFFGKLCADGAIVTAPQETSALLLGVSARPGGYTEEVYMTTGGMPLIAATRARLYDARRDVPACAAWSFASLDEYHGHSVEASEEDPVTYDHAVGSVFGYGHWGMLHARRLFLGPRTEALLRKWLDFYRRHRETLAGEMIHLRRPDGVHPDGHMFAAPDADPPAMLVLFNPSARKATASVVLPLHYAGFAPEGRAEVEGVGEVRLDSAGCAAVTVELAPSEIRTLAVRR